LETKILINRIMQEKGGGRCAALKKGLKSLGGEGDTTSKERESTLSEATKKGIIRGKVEREEG